MATHFLQSNENKTPENYMNAQKDEKKKNRKSMGGQQPKSISKKINHINK